MLHHSALHDQIGSMSRARAARAAHSRARPGELASTDDVSGLHSLRVRCKHQVDCVNREHRNETNSGKRHSSSVHDSRHDSEPRPLFEHCAPGPMRSRKQTVLTAQESRVYTSVPVHRTDLKSASALRTNTGLKTDLLDKFAAALQFCASSASRCSASPPKRALTLYTLKPLPFSLPRHCADCKLCTLFRASLDAALAARDGAFGCMKARPSAISQKTGLVRVTSVPSRHSRVVPLRMGWVVCDNLAHCTPICPHGAETVATYAFVEHREIVATALWPQKHAKDTVLDRCSAAADAG